MQDRRAAERQLGTGTVGTDPLHFYSKIDRSPTKRYSSSRRIRVTGRIDYASAFPARDEGVYLGLVGAILALACPKRESRR